MMKPIHNVPKAPSVDRATALDRLLSLTGCLAERMNEGMSARGLSRPRAALLMLLHHQGSAVQRQLSQALKVTPRHVTGLVDVLEADGWVTRLPHPTDRRATMVALTEAGKASVAAMEVDRREWAERLFAHVSENDLATFVKVVTTLQREVPRDPEDPHCVT